MPSLLRRLSLGISLAVLSLAIAGLASWLFGVDWWLVAILLLVIAALALFALSTMAGGHPPAWGGGRWTFADIYTETTGRGTMGSGPSDMSQPPGQGWDRRSFANGVLLLVVALLLVGAQLLS